MSILDITHERFVKAINVANNTTLTLADVVFSKARENGSAIHPGDFNWYDPDTWEDATSPAQAVTAFKAAAVRAGVGADVVLHDIVATREYDNELNRYYLVIATKSMVFHTGAKFQMPKHFSETVTVTELSGFIYEPIKPEDVVA